MNVKVLKESENEFEIEIDNIDISILEQLSSRLLKRKDVEFAAYKKEHPLVGKPKFMIKTKKKEAKEIFIKELEKMIEEWKACLKGIEK